MQDNDYEAMPDVQYFHFEINEMLDSAKLRENPLPVTQIYTVTDRRVYRPGEVAHLKGYVRDRRGNELRVPKLRSVTAILDREGEEKEIPARLEGNGAFSLDLPVEAAVMPIIMVLVAETTEMVVLKLIRINNAKMKAIPLPLVLQVQLLRGYVLMITVIIADVSLMKNFANKTTIIKLVRE